MKTRNVEQIVDALPALPVAVWNVMRLTNTPDAPLVLLEQAIAGDPALTSALLKLANSAYYGLPRQTSRLLEAIVFLGIKVVRNMSLTIGTMGIWSDNDHNMAAMRQAMWCRAVQKAVTAKALAKHVGSVDAENAFLAGLMHDIGKMVLLHQQPTTYVANEELMHQPVPDLPMEEEVFGVNHLEVGRLAGERWQLSESIVEAIGFHHDPCAATEHPQLSAIVFLADGLTWALEHWTDIAEAANAMPDTFPALTDVLSVLSLQSKDVVALLRCVEATYEDVLAILSLIYPDAPLPKGLVAAHDQSHTESIAPPRPTAARSFDPERILALEEHIFREQRAKATPLRQLWEWLTSLLRGTLSLGVVIGVSVCGPR